MIPKKIKPLDQLQIQMPLKSLAEILPEFQKKDGKAIDRVKAFASYVSYKHNEDEGIRKLKMKSFNQRVEETKGGK